MRQVRRVPIAGRMAERVDYEISVSTTLLFSTFQNVEREVIVGGLVCHDRLEALQRIFEHELLHLAEFLGWGRSSCSAENFHVLSRRIFAHEGVSHDLVTPREQAAVAFDVRVGDQVRFELEGRTYRGRVNRITRRATVLVESPRGERFSDGRRYLTFYVPLPFCESRAERVIRCQLEDTADSSADPGLAVGLLSLGGLRDWLERPLAGRFLAEGGVEPLKPVAAGDQDRDLLAGRKYSIRLDHWSGGTRSSPMARISSPTLKPAS